MKIFWLALFAGTILSCTQNIPGALRNDFYVTVENDGTDAVVLYHMRSGVPFRLGQVTPLATRTFTLPESLSPDAFCVKSSQEVFCTERVVMQANMLLAITAAYYLKQSTYMVSRLVGR